MSESRPHRDATLLHPIETPTRKLLHPRSSLAGPGLCIPAGRVGRGLRRARREARIVTTQDRGVRRIKYPELFVRSVGVMVIRLNLLSL